MNMTFNLHNKQTGFGLIEALIALFVFSVGLLGTVGIQAASMKNNRGALWQSQAVWAAYDIADRMRANTAGLDANEYDAADTATVPTDPACIATGCAPAALADTDIVEWASNVSSLPSGRGLIVRTGSQYRVRVMWDERGNGATGTDCNPNALTDLTCVDISLEL